MHVGSHTRTPVSFTRSMTQACPRCASAALKGRTRTAIRILELDGFAATGRVDDEGLMLTAEYREVNESDNVDWFYLLYYAIFHIQKTTRFTFREYVYGVHIISLHIQQLA